MKHQISLWKEDLAAAIVLLSAMVGGPMFVFTLERMAP